MKRTLAVLLTAALFASLFTFMFAAAEPPQYDVAPYKETETYTYPVQEGKVFAGWYKDSALQEPYTETTGQAYAKFVDANVLSVKAQVLADTTAQSETTDLRLITTVDDLSYRTVGFDVTINDTLKSLSSQTVYRTILSKSQPLPYTPDMFCADSQYFVTFSITEIPNSAFSVPVEVVPFWVTPDGTRVTAAQVEKTVSSVLPTESDYVKYMHEKYPDYVESEYGLDITFKEDLVSICYSTWHTYAHVYNNQQIYNVTNILKNGSKFGSKGAFHYWAEPELGYYENTEEEIVRTHMEQLADAGVDFIILDFTNLTRNANSDSIGNSGQSTWALMVEQPVDTLLNVCLQMREEGKNTPYIVPWIKNDTVAEFEAAKLPPDLAPLWNKAIEFVDQYMKNDQYKDLFVYLYNDFTKKPSPLVLGTSRINGKTWSMNSKAKRSFSYRTMWGLEPNTADNVNSWSFIDHTSDGNLPNAPYEGTDWYEQISVSPAQQKTYMSKTTTAMGRNGGQTFRTQWQNAFKYRPKVVTISWWNEWVAQIQTDGGLLAESSFIDNYTQEYSRDIEPMKDGHGNQYYLWMKEYIRAYKNHEECPMNLVENPAE